MDEFVDILFNTEHGTDILEVCGGEARVTQLVVRRGLRSGGNFDLRTGVDLNRTPDQRKVMHYVEHCKPLVILLHPRCTPFGPQGRQNQWVDPLGW